MIDAVNTGMESYPHINRAFLDALNQNSNDPKRHHLAQALLAAVRHYAAMCNIGDADVIGALMISSTMAINHITQDMRPDEREKVFIGFGWQIINNAQVQFSKVEKKIGLA